MRQAYAPPPNLSKGCGLAIHQHRYLKHLGGKPHQRIDGDNKKYEADQHVPPRHLRNRKPHQHQGGRKRREERSDPDPGLLRMLDDGGNKHHRQIRNHPHHPLCPAGVNILHRCPNGGVHGCDEEISQHEVQRIRYEMNDRECTQCNRDKPACRKAKEPAPMVLNPSPGSAFPYASGTSRTDVSMSA